MDQDEGQLGYRKMEIDINFKTMTHHNNPRMVIEFNNVIIGDQTYSTIDTGHSKHVTPIEGENILRVWLKDKDPKLGTKVENNEVVADTGFEIQYIKLDNLIINYDSMERLNVLYYTDTGEILQTLYMGINGYIEIKFNYPLWDNFLNSINYTHNDSIEKWDNVSDPTDIFDFLKDIK